MKGGVALHASMPWRKKFTKLAPDDSAAAASSSCSSIFAPSGTIALLAASPSVAEVLLTINATTLPGYTTYSVSAEVPFATTATYNTTLAFNMSDATLPLRVVADRTLVEVFLGGGRGVVSTPVLAPGKSPDNGGVFFSAPAAPFTVASASAWEMGCGWAR